MNTVLLRHSITNTTAYSYQSTVLRPVPVSLLKVICLVYVKGDRKCCVTALISERKTTRSTYVLKPSVHYIKALASRDRTGTRTEEFQQNRSATAPSIYNHTLIKNNYSWYFEYENSLLTSAQINYNIQILNYINFINNINIHIENNQLEKFNK